MSFWVGAAKAFGEYKEEEFAREQAQADRDFRVGLEERSNKAAMERVMAGISSRRQELLTTLRAQREAAQASASSQTGYVQALANLVEGAEGAEEWMEPFRQNPQAAQAALETIYDRQDKAGISFDPNTIVANITPVITDGGVSMLSPDLDEMTRLQAESAIEVPEPVISIGPDLFDNPTGDQVNRAQDFFETAIIDRARETVTKLEGPEQSNLQAILDRAEEGNKFALAKLSDRFGVQAVASLYSLGDVPELSMLPRVPTATNAIRQYNIVTEAYNDPAIKPEEREILENLYPFLFGNN